MYLAKYVALCGVCSRRKAVDLVRDGSIFIDEVVCTDPVFQVEQGHAVVYKLEISYEDKSGNQQKRVKEMRLLLPATNLTLMLNKPAGYLTTVTDPFERKTVMDLMKLPVKPRLYPIGRLDKDTTGLLLFTNNGDLTQRLSHPSYGVEKVYYATLDKSFTVAAASALKEGVMLADGMMKVDKVWYPHPEDQKVVAVKIHSGRNRVVRRLFKRLGFYVTQLDRVSYGPLLKDEELAVGKWRVLTQSEVETLDVASRKSQQTNSFN